MANEFDTSPDLVTRPETITAPETSTAVEGTITVTADHSVVVEQDEVFFTMVEGFTTPVATSPAVETTRIEDILYEQQQVNLRNADQETEPVTPAISPDGEPVSATVQEPEPSTPPRPVVNMDQQRQALGELGSSHATGDLRTDEAARQQALNTRLEELTAQYNLTEQQVNQLRETYNTEYQRVATARAEALAASQQTLTTQAQTHSTARVDETVRTQALDTELQRIQQQYNLSEQEVTALRTHYQTQYQTAETARQQQVQQQITAAHLQLEELARQQAANPNREQITQGLREIVERHSAGLDPDQIRGLATHLENRLGHHRDQHLNQRQAAMLAEIQAAARDQAAADLGRDYGHDRDLGEIIRRYPDVAGRVSEEHIRNTFQNSYDGRYNDIYNNELNWFQRRYYDVAGALSSAWNALSNALNYVREHVPIVDAACNLAECVGELAVEAGQAIYEAGRLVVNTVVEVVETVATAVVDAYEWCRENVTWENIQSVFNSAVSAIGSAVEWCKENITFENIWNGICTAASAVADAAVYVWENRDQILSAAWEGLKSAGRFVGRLATLDAEAWGQVWDGVCAAGTFLKDMSDAIGLTDLAVGVWNIAVVAPFQAVRAVVETGINVGMLLTGQISKEEFKNNMKESWGRVGEAVSEGARALKGAVMVLGELTGVTDVIMCCKYALEGNWAMAGMHLAFAAMSVGSLAATIATGGAAAGSMVAVAAGRSTVKAAAKQVLKVACKEFLETAGKEMGEQVLKNVAKEIGQETLQQTIKQTASEGAERVAKEAAEAVLRNGPEALTTELMEQLGKDIGAETTERMLRELGVDRLVREEVEKLLKEAANPKELMERLKALGVDDKAAKEMADSFRQALKSGKVDDAMIEQLTQSISKPITEYIQQQSEQVFKDRMQSILQSAARGLDDDAVQLLGREGHEALGRAIRENAERLGKSVDEYIDELTEAAWKGYKEGIREAVEKVVREAVTKAFDEYRRPRARMDLGAGNIQVGITKNVFEGLAIPDPVKRELEERLPAERPELMDGSEAMVTRIITAADGTEVMVTERYSVQKQRWETLSAQVVGEKREKSSSMTGSGGDDSNT